MNRRTPGNAEPPSPAPTRRAGAAVGAWALLAALAAFAQPGAALAPADRSFLERLALARARASLYDQVTALPLHDDLTVGRWAAQDLPRDRELRLWIRTRPRCGSARIYSDSTCDVDVRLAPDELASHLIAQLEQAPPPVGTSLTPARIRNAARRWPILFGSGSAALSERTESRKPAGWEDITFEGIQLARRAAAADAVHALLEQAGRLKVTPARRLAEFLDSDPEVFAAVYAAVESAAALSVEHAPDQIAVAEARIGMADLIRILTDVHQQHYRGDAFHAPDFREMALTTSLSELRAAGLATPPERHRLRQPYALIELDRPPWAATSLSVTGTYDPLDTEQFTPEVQIELARFDGMDELRKQVESLVVGQGVTVGQLLGYRPALKDDVVIFLSGARVVSAPETLPDGKLRLRVELPLLRLWHIVRRAMTEVEVEPAAASAPSPPPMRESDP